MRNHRKCLVRLVTPNSLAGIALLLALIVAVPVGADLPPPTWTRPQVTKIAMPEPDSLALGDRVRFFITVENPKTQGKPIDWYQVEATDVVSSVLEIDAVDSGIVGYEGEEPVMQITDNTVVVTVDLLQSRDYFIFQIVCTVVGPLETGMTIVNLAKVDYEDSEGSAGQTVYSDPVMIPVDYYSLFLPIIRGYLS